MWDEYRLYASCIAVIAVLSCGQQLRDTLRNLKNIKKMAYYNCRVKVMREGDESKLTEINSVDLVPGDIIEIPENCSMPCDIALLSGTCIVNESMLTGESIPVIKNPLPRIKDIYNVE